MSVNVTEAPRRRVTLREVRAYREEILALAGRRGVGNVRIFGSVARGDADEGSDLDLLIDHGPETDLVDLAGFALDVEETLGVYTQVATVRGLKPRTRDRVLGEAVALCETTANDCWTSLTTFRASIGISLVPESSSTATRSSKRR